MHITQGDYDGKAMTISWMNPNEPGPNHVLYGCAYGALTQIATCLGLMDSFFIGIPTKEIVGWYGKLSRLADICEDMFTVAL